MSRYSGRSDVYDTFVAIHNYTDEELRNNVEVYIDNNTPLQIDSLKSLIPYYPHIISSACFDNKERKAVIHIASTSSVDTEEEKYLISYLEEILKIYDRCKRKKIEFNVDDVVKELAWFNWNIEPITEIANRVKEKGKRATVDGIHLRMHECYRQLLVNEMIKNGLDPCNYGYERFVKKEEAM